MNARRARKQLRAVGGGGQGSAVTCETHASALAGDARLTVTTGSAERRTSRGNREGGRGDPEGRIQGLSSEDRRDAPRSRERDADRAVQHLDELLPGQTIRESRSSLEEARAPRRGGARGDRTENRPRREEGNVRACARPRDVRVRERARGAKSRRRRAETPRRRAVRVPDVARAAVAGQSPRYSPTPKPGTQSPHTVWERSPPARS